MGILSCEGSATVPRTASAVAVSFAIDRPGISADEPPNQLASSVGVPRPNELGNTPWLIVLEDGRVFAFGENPYNGLGLPAPAPAYVGDMNGPVQLPAEWGNVQSLSATFYYSLFAVDNTGAVRTSGESADDELGLGDLAQFTRFDPVSVLAETCTTLPCADLLTGVSDIATNNQLTTLAIKQGRILGWGNAGNGLLGPGFPANATQPFPRFIPATLTGVTQISSANSHALVVGPANAVYAWGNGLRGTLGDGLDTNRDTPTLVIVP